ncbi:sulfite exporter TauE/SafE family protein [Medicago truncatula]|uniref:Sulfite exporter TauE/SafE family protein n=2 Tax=Medicago truncatula TaxID=3880 RepID=G7L815_MEDTR|nr:sulfite exporter TauE/SafE family protein [Medicago truncatula]
MVVRGSERRNVKWVIPGRSRVLIISLLLLSSYVTSSHQYTDQKTTPPSNETKGDHAKVFYKHTWPGMKFGWRIIVGTILAFLGSSFGTVGGVGGGGIVPMLTLIIGFDAKSATAISKCMITGGAGATVLYNLRQRHPTLDLPVIDYDLALLFQPMLMLGISLGVAFNVIFPDWMITSLILIFFTGISVKAFLKGVNTWKNETLAKKEARDNSQLNDIRRIEDVELDLQAGESVNDNHTNTNIQRKKVSVIENVSWKEVGLLFFVWIMILALQIGKSYTITCSVAYWILNLLQVPIAVGVSSYEAVLLYKGKKVIASKGDQGINWSVKQLILYCSCGIIAGLIGGLLGLGGGFILAPLFLGLGIPPQVSSATSTFAMTFSASMSVVEYYLLKRFPIPYALYFVVVATVAALVGQHLVRKLIVLLGRASIIIFILALTVFVSGISLGGTGIASLIKRTENKEYMGFGSLCAYRVRN